MRERKKLVSQREEKRRGEERAQLKQIGLANARHLRHTRPIGRRRWQFNIQFEPFEDSQSCKLRANPRGWEGKKSAGAKKVAHKNTVGLTELVGPARANKSAPPVLFSSSFSSFLSAHCCGFANLNFLPPARVARKEKEVGGSRRRRRRIKNVAKV